LKRASEGHIYVPR